jgi:hypothetical protein
LPSFLNILSNVLIEYSGQKLFPVLSPLTYTLKTDPSLIFESKCQLVKHLTFSLVSGEDNDDISK